MRIFSGLWVLAFFQLSVAVACDDFSGVYKEIDDGPIGSNENRGYVITQNGCEYTIRLMNGAITERSEQVRADGIAYDRSPAHIDPEVGEVTHPFLPLSSDSTGYLKTTNPPGLLVMTQVWNNHPERLSLCSDDFNIPQELGSGCNRQQVVLTRSETTLTETLNLDDGLSLPIVTRFQRGP